MLNSVIVYVSQVVFGFILECLVVFMEDVVCFN